MGRANPRPGRAGLVGFTLLEVMVAVAILGLGLTAILSAQAGAFSSATHARNLSLATGLARCKMTELEERIAKDGLPELDESDSGPCCEGDESPLKCAWRIEKPEMPEPKYGELNLDTEIGGGKLGDLAQLGKPGEGSGAPGTGNLNDIAQGLAGLQGGEGGGSGGGMDDLFAPFVEMLYPTIKPIFEASARRVTVKLTWQEGKREHAIELAQWVTVPQMGAPPADGAEDDQGSRSSGSGEGPELSNGRVPPPPGRTGGK